MGDRDLLLSLLTTVSGLVVMFVLLLIWVKIRRDRSEQASRRLEQRLVDSWKQRDAAEMTQTLSWVARGTVGAMTDLVSVLSRCELEPWFDEPTVAAVSSAVDASGLRRRMLADLSSRRVATRGLAVRLAGFSATRLPAARVAPMIRDGNATVRLATVATLEKVATDAAAQVLVDALEHDALPAPRIIERLGHPWATTTILDRLDDRSLNSRIRSSLLRALALAADPSALETGLLAARSAHADERIQSFRILTSCHDGADASQLARVAEAALAASDDEDPTVRSMALALLGSINDSRGLEVLTAHTRDPDWFVRRAAARALIASGAAGRERLRELARGTDAFAAARAREELSLAGEPPCRM